MNLLLHTSRKTQRGFSLIELIFVMVISSIIVGLLGRFLLLGVNTYFFLDKSKEIMRNTRLSIHYMNRDFRQVRHTNGINNATAAQFDYWNYEDKHIVYQFDDHKIKRNGNTLADNILSFQFRYLKADRHYLQTPVTSDSLKFIWNVAAVFTVSENSRNKRVDLLVHPRNY